MHVPFLLSIHGVLITAGIVKYMQFLVYKNNNNQNVELYGHVLLFVPPSIFRCDTINHKIFGLIRSCSVFNKISIVWSDHRWMCRCCVEFIPKSFENWFFSMHVFLSSIISSWAFLVSGELLTKKYTLRFVCKI